MGGESLFNSAHAALVFAFNWSSQCYDRPMMNRMASGPAMSSGKGLVGLDGAAQAGMIRYEVKSLGRLAEAIITARIAPHSTPCQCRSSCCSGQKANREWVDALAYLADHIRNTALAGCVSNGIMRREYLVRYFSKKDQRSSLDDLARKYEIDRHTVSAHNAKVMAYLGGTLAKKDGTGSPGFEAVAFNAIGDRLRETGLAACSLVCY